MNILSVKSWISKDFVTDSKRSSEGTKEKLYCGSLAVFDQYQDTVDPAFFCFCFALTLIAEIPRNCKIELLFRFDQYTQSNQEQWS